MKKYILLITFLIFTGCLLGFKTNQPNGIDISHHNTVNWDIVKKNPDIKFVYIKATEGDNFVDNTFTSSAKSANSIGLHVGAYHYFRTDVSGEAQFKNFSKQLDKIKFDLIPAIDVEIQNNDFNDKEQVKEQLSVLVNSIHEKYGVYPMLYIGSKEALFVISYFNHLKLWIRTLQFSNYIPYITVKQIGYTEIGTQTIDSDYCSDLSEIIIK